MSNEGTAHLRKLVAGLSMIGSPLLGLLAWVLRPTLRREEIDQLSGFASATGRATSAILLNTASIALGAIAVFGLVHLLRESESILGTIGGGLGIFGLVVVAMSSGVDAAGVALARAGVTSANAAIYEDITTSPIGRTLQAGGLLVSVGLVVLAVALLRERVVPEPSGFLVGVFAIVQLVGFVTFSSPLVAAAFAALAAGLVPVGVRLLTEPDADWAHSPRFHWYHPVQA